MTIKNKFLCFLTIPLLSACNDKSKVKDLPSSLFEQPNQIELKEGEGYTVNHFTGDTVEALINSLGDTLKTGVLIPAKGKVVKLDSLPKIKKFSLDQTKLKSVKAHPNVHHITKSLQRITVKQDSLTVITLKNIKETDTSHYLVNSIGDSIRTGIKIPAKGKEAQTFQPNATKALPPRFKDAAITDLQYLDVDQGMESSYVKSLLLDRNGNIWIGTLGGASLYNGSSFKHFNEESGLSGNSVYSMLEDSEGNLWFGTHGAGVSKYDGKTFTHFKEEQGLSSNYVWSMLEDRKGNLWFGTTMGLSKYDGKSFTHFTEKEGLSSNYVMSIQEDQNQVLWIGTDGGGVNKFDGKSFTHYMEKDGLSNNTVMTIIEDHGGNLWFGTYGGGLNKFNGKSFTHYTEEIGLRSNYIASSTIDEEGNLWFGTYGGGVFKYEAKLDNNCSKNTCNHKLEDSMERDQHLKKASQFFIHYTKKEGLSNDFILSMIKDESGSIWLGTDGGGLSKINDHSFAHFTFKEGQGSDIIMSITEDQKGSIWLGTDGNGVICYKDSTFSHLTQETGLSSNTVTCILEDKKGILWFGTYDGGLNRYDGESIMVFNEETGLSNNTIMSIKEDKSGNIWIGTDGGGVNKYDGKSFIQFTEREGLSNNTVMSILEDKNGNMWFGTNGGGVNKYDGNHFIYYTENEGFSSNSIISMHEDGNGNLWFGTYGGGLTIYKGNDSITDLSSQKDIQKYQDTTKAVLLHFSEKEGLSNNYVWSITEDNNGIIWLSTENGITSLLNDSQAGRISLEGEHELSLKEEFSLLKAVNFSKMDGIKGTDFFLNSACLDNKDQLWWGSGKSLTKLDLNKHQIAQKTPKITLNQIDINEQFVDYTNNSDSLLSDVSYKSKAPFQNYPLELVLPYDKNHLTFHFSATDWNAPHKIKYSYLVEGFNSDWSIPSKELKADYRNIPYGDYSFKVRAIGESGEWSEALAYPFTILTPWWHSWWARTLYGISAIFLVFSFVLWRTANLKQKQRVLESKVNNATQEIRQQKNEIEVAHREITDSIEYAKRIQTAILPPDKLVKEHLADSFIFYLPKDVVAGDFYWMESITNEGSSDTEKIVLFAAADCTGHGVPGAMVSVICVNGLNRAVREFGLHKPAKILDKTRELVLKEFEKSETEVRDGMDISLCALNTKTNQLQWAGANNPIWIVRKDSEVMEEIKGDKQPIGQFELAMPFTNHQLQLQTGDTIYIFSDGYPDQFGGEKGKKYKSGRFKRTLVDLSKSEITQQHDFLKAEFKNWKGELEQLDDVCVIGVRIT